MIISASFLKIQKEKEKVKRLNDIVDQIHYDIMDGLFVPNKTIDFNEMQEIDKFITKPKDIHLMVKEINKYVDMYKQLHPNYIIFHLEATENIEETINYIKNNNIKVGIAINPNTNPIDLKPYLNKIDLVLVMSVFPGKGGQQFIDMTHKVEYLYEYRKYNNLNYLIEVDGGINNENIKLVNKADIIVVGSYITDSDNYEKQLKELKGDNNE